MKTKRTKMLEYLLAKKFDTRNDFFVFECTYGWYGKEIVDCIMYNCKREVHCFEIKQSVQDFHSKNKLSFFGNKNYFVMPYELYMKVNNEIYNNFPDVGVYVPIKTPKYGDKEYEYDVYDQLLCIKQARKVELKADKEVILSSMLRSMQRDRFDYYTEIPTVTFYEPANMTERTKKYLIKNNLEEASNSKQGE